MWQRLLRCVIVFAPLRFPSLWLQRGCHLRSVRSLLGSLSRQDLRPQGVDHAPAADHDVYRDVGQLLRDHEGHQHNAEQQALERELPESIE